MCTLCVTLRSDVQPDVPARLKSDRERVSGHPGIHNVQCGFNITYVLFPYAWSGFWVLDTIDELNISRWEWIAKTTVFIFYTLFLYPIIVRVHHRNGFLTISAGLPVAIWSAIVYWSVPAFHHRYLPSLVSRVCCSRPTIEPNQRCRRNSVTTGHR